MPEDFQQTVDLRDRTEKRRSPAPPKKVVTPLQKIYQDEEPIEPIKNLQRISRPKISQPRDGLIRLIVFILAILVVSATLYFLFFRSKTADQKPLTGDWYAVEMADGKIYYGQVLDVKAEPLKIINVYYDYDRKKAIDDKKAFVETANIRLVKLDKETQGGDGSMLVYPANGWPTMKPLRPDSKVLQAILQYEK